MKSLSQALQEALAHHRAGRLREAEALYRQILDQAPQHAYTLSLLGLARHQQGDQGQARDFLRRAIACDPENAGYHVSLGLVDEAARDFDAARHDYEAALRLDPGHTEARFMLGRLLLEANHHEEAIAQFQQVLELDDGHVGALNHLARACQQTGHLDEAAEYYRRILSLAPNDADTYFDLGCVQRAQGNLEGARQSFEKAISLDPADAMACNNLGTILKDLGRAEEAVRCFEKAHALDPSVPIFYSNLLFTLTYNVMATPEKILKAHREWDRLYTCRNPADLFRYEGRDDDPHRRLRIGYLSPDLRSHPVSYFIEPILEHHGREAVEVFCYAEVSEPDEVTRRLEGKSDHWRSTVGMPDEAVARVIHEDGIDILIDLAGHTANSRLRVLTFKPAPVQATYLGYFSTTGLAAMDYWISDETLHPPDTVELATETIFRLPRCCLAYSPSPAAPPVSLPEESDCITFGSFNHLTKITPDCIALWSDVLKAVPGSRMLLKNRQLADPLLRKRLEASFASQGVDPARLELLSHVEDYREHMALYSRVDISLDTVPRTGGSTTADALWMGVPVITLAGARFIQRLSASMVSALGLEELTAGSREDYIAKAVALAQDPERRRALRTTLRDRMAASPLCDARGLAQALEDAYRQMWTVFLGQGK